MWCSREPCKMRKTTGLMEGIMQPFQQAGMPRSLRLSLSRLALFQIWWQYWLRALQGVSKRALQWYSKCFCMVSVTKTFTLKGGQTTHWSRCWTMVSLYSLKCKRFRNTRHTSKHPLLRVITLLVILELLVRIGFWGYVAVFVQLYCRYCTFASCRTLFLHFHFLFLPLCGLSMFKTLYRVLNTCHFLKSSKSRHVSAWLGHAQVLIVFKKIAVILFSHARSSLYLSCVPVPLKITTCFGLNWPSSGVHCF
jgi:hypothetical protein